jgi:hypothetical protein
MVDIWRQLSKLQQKVPDMPQYIEVKMLAKAAGQ